MRKPPRAATSGRTGATSRDWLIAASSRKRLEIATLLGLSPSTGGCFQGRERIGSYLNVIRHSVVAGRYCKVPNTRRPNRYCTATATLGHDHVRVSRSRCRQVGGECAAGGRRGNWGAC